MDAARSDLERMQLSGVEHFAISKCFDTAVPVHLRGPPVRTARQGTLWNLVAPSIRGLCNAMVA